MSTTEIKENISKLSEKDRNDILLYIMSLPQKEPEISAEWWEEIERRERALEAGEMKTRPAHEVIEELRRS